jgi:hypothetical protein
MFAVVWIPGVSSGWAAPQEREGLGPAAEEEGLREQDLTPEEQEAMQAWVASMEDASPMGDRIFPKLECMQEPYHCPKNTNCNFDGTSVSCIVTQCGDGKCGMCPKFLSQLIYKGWCAYGCMKVDKMVGGAFILKHHFKGNDGNTGTWCIDKDGKIYN